MACPPGWASNVTGAYRSVHKCQVCSAGFYSPGGSVECKPTNCLAGYSSPAGSDVEVEQCSPCAAGYLSLGGSSQCELAKCKPGYATPPAAAGGCVQCASGYHSSGGATKCIACSCDPGSTCLSPDSATCSPCPNGTTTSRLLGGCVKTSNDQEAYVNVVLSVDGYSPPYFNQQVVNSFRDGLMSFLNDDEPAASSKVASVDPSAIVVDAEVDSTSDLGGSLVTLRLALASSVGNIYSSLESLTTSDGALTGSSTLASFIQHAGLVRVRNVQVQSVQLWQQGHETSRSIRQSESPSYDNETNSIPSTSSNTTKSPNGGASSPVASTTITSAAAARRGMLSMLLNVVVLLCACICS
ncbi:hypothetical protein AaE_002526 [Aphanomyces astaci]|uniref:Tyrosine-protein kinase ephrin type A/B receptor-like domain-containing protein n=1 Tax=Aphanomyces astaci TaxID=112090 RepID=A0A6A5ATW7_APHAT|nr:hypothetical protein AaE_002526 [Aphanomyces astaci]